MRQFLLFLFAFTTLMASSYNFEEIRYSDAFDSTVELHGQISFESDSLFIKYDNSDKTILYKDAELIFKEAGRELDLDEVQKQRVSEYFKVLLLLHSDDKELLEEKFSIEEEVEQTLLKPKEELRRYIEKIILKKEQDRLKEVVLFLSNSDTITIRLEDEIR